MAVIRLFVVLMAVTTLCAPTKVVYKDCGSETGKINYVDVGGCTQEPCELKHNTNVSVSVDFTSLNATKTATAVVAGIVGGVPIPFPIPEADACKCGVKCPLAANIESLYSVDLYVDPSYPDLRLIVKWEIKDDQLKDLVCFLIPVKIVD